MLRSTPTHGSASSRLQAPISAALNPAGSHGSGAADAPNPILRALPHPPTLSKPKPAAASKFDIEQPPARTPPTEGEFELVERMPGLRHPSVLRAMTHAVADVSGPLRAPADEHYCSWILFKGWCSSSLFISVLH